MRTLDEIIETLATRYDHEELCDLLGISTEELLWSLETKVAEKYDELNEEIENG